MRLTAAAVIIALCAAAPVRVVEAAVPASPAPALFEDPLDPAGVAVILQAALAGLQDAMDRLWQWLDALRRTAAGAVGQIVLPLPTDVPTSTGPLDAVAALAGLPAEWRGLAATARAKLGVANPSDATAVQHKTDIAGSPQLTHEAAVIAAADQQAVSGALQQEVGVAATAAVARAAAHDATLGAAVAVSRAAGDELAAGAQNLPSSRAGIELLVSGMGAGLRQQADLLAAVAVRLNGVIQQGSQLSAQIGTLATTLEIFTARDVERDRRALDARLGVADAADGGGVVLRQLLEGAGEPADEIRLAPLY